MFKLARRRYLQEVFGGSSSCTGDCGQGRRCTCSGKSEEMSRPPETGLVATHAYDAANPSAPSLLIAITVGDARYD